MTLELSLIWYPAFLLLVVLFVVVHDWVMENNLCGMGPVICSLYFYEI